METLKTLHLITLQPCTKNKHQLLKTNYVLDLFIALSSVSYWK
ncbi:MAG: hypothetical protein RL331_39 [Bacteroidota bacterium]|jgi:hypothetical protein